MIGVIDMDKVFESLGLEEWAAGSYVGEIVFDFKLSEELEVKTDNTYALTVVLSEHEEDEESSSERTSSESNE